METLRRQIERHIEAESPNLLAAAGLAPFREVAGAAALPNILAGRVSAPGCYVYRARVRPQPNVYDDAVMQRVETYHGVVVVVKNLRDSRQGDASDEAEAYCDIIQGLLLNWSPAPIYEPFEYAGGQVVRMQHAHLYWQELYRSAHIIRHT